MHPKGIAAIYLAMLVASQPPDAVLQARVTWYDPSRCQSAPINCYDAEQWWRMSGGHDARHLYGVALACPEQYYRWVFKVRGRYYRCLDAGGAVVTGADGVISLDILSRVPVPGGVVEVKAWKP